MQYIGVFGSAFDPPTLGHLDVIKQAETKCCLILLVPCIRHPFAKKTLSFESRLKLLHAFVADISISTKVEISEVEKELCVQKPGAYVYTYDVMHFLEKIFTVPPLMFIRGPDNALKERWRLFYRYQHIEQRWALFTASERVDIRSSSVRSWLQLDMKKWNNKKRCALQQYVTPRVAQCILDHRFYLSEE